MLRKVRTEDQKESTQQLDSPSKTQETSYTSTQATGNQPKNPNWDKILNYLIGGLGVIVAVLIISLIVRVNSSSEESKAEPTHEVAADLPTEGSLDGAPVKSKTIRVEVLNGSGVPKLAAKAADFLRSKGFDVVSTGNASNSNYKKTIIQDRAGNIQNAQQVANALGVPETGIIQQKNPQLLLEVTIIVGQDYKTLKFQNSGNN